MSESHVAVLTVLRNFYQKEHDIDAVDGDGRTMLCYAVDAGHEDDIKINEPESESNDPLSAAISRDLLGVVQSLLSMIVVHGDNGKDPGGSRGLKTALWGLWSKQILIPPSQSDQNMVKAQLAYSADAAREN